MKTKINKGALEELYGKLNRREFVRPDPLEVLYGYEDAADREVAGLVSSSLAYGRVAQILKSVAVVLEKLGPSPRKFLEAHTAKTLARGFDGFKHRFTTAEEVAALMVRVKKALEKHGSLEACFLANFDVAGTVATALAPFAEELHLQSDCRSSSLVPDPSCGSACKRLNLYLRWMVRKDDVDPGGWEGVPPSALIVPLDTHMFRICTALGFTKRKQADLRAAMEITDAFRKFSPEDPVKYDFALTRLGIRSDMNADEFLGKYAAR